jgi:hypothetical protein
MEMERIEIEGLPIQITPNELYSLDYNELAHKHSIIDYRINYLRNLEKYNLFNRKQREEYNTLCNILEDYAEILRIKNKKKGVTSLIEEINCFEKFNKKYQYASDKLDIYDDSELKKYKHILKLK